MPDDISGGRPRLRPRLRWCGRPLLLTVTAVAAATVGAGLALAATSGPSRFPLPSAVRPGSLSCAGAGAAAIGALPLPARGDPAPSLVPPPRSGSAASSPGGFAGD
jgi:hypothetical protein